MTAEPSPGVMLETERLLLRPWRESDAPELYRYAKDPAVGPAAGWPPHTDVENSREIIRTVLSVPETYAVVLKETGLPVGSVGIMRRPHGSARMKWREAEIGYWIGVPYWGRGLIPEAVEALMTHAFADLGLAMLWCGHFDGNLASERVQAKCGFRHRRTETNRYVAPIDAFRTVHISSISRQEWQQRLSARHH